MEPSASSLDYGHFEGHRCSIVAQFRHRGAGDHSDCLLRCTTAIHQYREMCIVGYRHRKQLWSCLQGGVVRRSREVDSGLTCWRWSWCCWSTDLVRLGLQTWSEWRSRYVLVRHCLNSALLIRIRRGFTFHQCRVRAIVASHGCSATRSPVSCITVGRLAER